MEHDLFFTIIDKHEWKTVTNTGKFNPSSIESEGFINCIHEKDIDKYLNSLTTEIDAYTLIVIDPLRVQESIKSETVNDIRFIKIKGSLHLDAIIDKIQIGRDKKGKFRVGIKHFD